MMRILTKAAPFGAIALLVAGSAFAGGAHCGSKESAAATTASTGGHCDGASSASMAKSCGVKANQAIYSFAVPTATCDHCVKSIQSALMAQKGVACAHVDLATHTAYVIADKSMNKKAVAKTIQTAGFKNNYKGEGTKVQAEFAKAMSAGDKGASSCSRKEKDKV